MHVNSFGGTCNWQLKGGARLIEVAATAGGTVVLKATWACHPAKCLLPVEIIERCGLTTGPATVELLPYLLPY